MIPHIVARNSITVLLDGATKVIHDTHPNYEIIKEALRQDDVNIIRQYIDVASTVTSWGNGSIRVENGQVVYGTEVIHGTVVDRILAMISDNFDPAPMVAFLENLLQNPSRTSVEELYLFLETNNLPITGDGHFLAYKKVRSDYRDIHSGSFDNSPGQVVSMPRNRVDDQRNNTCSHGLHFCSQSYLPCFGSSHGNRVVLVKINPADVVSIPSDYDNAKGRTWKYEVLEDVTDKVGALATTSVYGYTPSEDADWDNRDNDAYRTDVLADIADYNEGLEDGRADGYYSEWHGDCYVHGSGADYEQGYLDGYNEAVANIE